MNCWSTVGACDNISVKTAVKAAIKSITLHLFVGVNIAENGNSDCSGSERWKKHLKSVCNICRYKAQFGIDSLEKISLLAHFWVCKEKDGTWREPIPESLTGSSANEGWRQIMYLLVSITINKLRRGNGETMFGIHNEFMETKVYRLEYWVECIDDIVRFIFILTKTKEFLVKLSFMSSFWKILILLLFLLTMKLLPKCFQRRVQGWWWNFNKTFPIC